MKEVKIFLKKENLDKFYKKIYLYRFLSIFKIKFLVVYKDKKYIKNSNNAPKELYIILNVLDILNSKTRKEKYTLIYDYACEYLDNEFKTKNHCDFKNDMCICNRFKERSKQLSSCCESLKTNKVCDNFDNVNKCCKIKSLGCKLFVCPYLRKKGVKYRVNYVPYLKYFLSMRQKAISITSIFTDKDIVIDKYLKFYKMP